MLTRREFMVRSVATAVAASTAAPAVASAKTSAGVRTFIDGALIEQHLVTEWELRRISVAAARLSHQYADLVRGELDSFAGIARGPVADVAAARSGLSRARARIGEDRLRAMLAPELAASEAAIRATLAASGGRWTASVVEIASNRGSAQGFVDWFHRAREIDARDVWTDACPDHYIIATTPDGRQEVVEVTGGAVLPSRFFVDYTPGAGRDSRRPGFPAHRGGYRGARQRRADRRRMSPIPR